MAGASVEIDDHEVLQALIRLQHAVGDLTPVFNDIGESLLQSTEQRFRDEVDPDGNDWDQLSKPYRETKPYNQDKILTLDGHLGGELVRQVEGAALAIGTETKYGATHQFGRPEANIKPRPFLGLSAADKTEVLGIILHHLEKAI